MKKILVINGNPKMESYCKEICKSYIASAVKGGADVKFFDVSVVEFETNLSGGYSFRTELEPVLLEFQELIKWSEHQVWVHPLWWGSFPAKMKGLIDRAFLPGFAFKYRENSVWWDKLLIGRTARVITTMDQPYFFYRWINGRPAEISFKRMILEFCGIKPVTISAIGPVRGSTQEMRTTWLGKVGDMALKDCK